MTVEANLSKPFSFNILPVSLNRKIPFVLPGEPNFRPARFPQQFVNVSLRLMAKAQIGGSIGMAVRSPSVRELGRPTRVTVHCFRRRSGRKPSSIRSSGLSAMFRRSSRYPHRRTPRHIAILLLKADVVAVLPGRVPCELGLLRLATISQPQLVPVWPLGTSVGWAPYQIFVIIAASVSGLITGEWRGAGRRALGTLVAGLVLLALATAIISYGNSY